jgi:hypothetical protein
VRPTEVIVSADRHYESLIEAVAMALDPQAWEPPCGVVSEYLRDDARDAARAALSAVFSWRDDKPCPECKGNGIKSIPNPNGDDNCVLVNCQCGSGRVEGDRRVILARQVPDLGLHGHDQYIDGVPFGSNVKAGEGYHGTFPLDPDDVPVFVATPVQEETE